MKFRLPQGFPLSVVLFQVYIDDAPLNDEDSLFMDDCVLTCGASFVIELYVLFSAKLSWIVRNLSMPFLSIEVLSALGSTLKKELIDSGVSLWLLRWIA